MPRVFNVLQLTPRVKISGLNAQQLINALTALSIAILVKVKKQKPQRENSRAKSGWIYHF